MAQIHTTAPTDAEALRQALAALQTAYRFIFIERSHFAAANRNPDGSFDAGEAAELADYDKALAEIGAAIAATMPAEVAA